METNGTILDALGDPTRRRIFESLKTGPQSVGELAGGLPVSRPAVSQHLRVLKQSGLVDVQPRAQQRLYELRAQRLRQLHEWLERYRRVWDARFEEMDELIEELKAKEKSNDHRKRK